MMTCSHHNYNDDPELTDKWVWYGFGAGVSLDMVCGLESRAQPNDQKKSLRSLLMLRCGIGLRSRKVEDTDDTGVVYFGLVHAGYP